MIELHGQMWVCFISLVVTSVVEGSTKLLKPKQDAKLTCNVKTDIPIKIEGVTLVWKRHGEVVKSVKDKYDFEGNESSSQLTVHVVGKSHKDIIGHILKCTFHRCSESEKSE